MFFFLLHFQENFNYGLELYMEPFELIISSLCIVKFERLLPFNFFEYKGQLFFLSLNIRQDLFINVQEQLSYHK